MRSGEKVRVAAVQCAAGGDVDENLATCLRMIDLAAKDKPDLVVLPEFMNHLSWYENKEHCARVSVDPNLDGPFLQAIAERARTHRLHVVVNCTVRRAGGELTGTSLLLSPEGKVLTTSDKQVLMGHENDFLVPGREPSAIAETAIGRIGLYACMDGVICETPRSLALRGAQILCNSLNSFAPDEASLHVPVRAAENRCFVVAANKVGPLIPEALLEPVSQATNIPKHLLYGAGESQIVGPDGTVLAKGPREGEAVVVADIDPREADAKRRPDGTNVFAARRRDLYAPIAARPEPIPIHAGAAEELRAGVLVTAAEGEASIEEAAKRVTAAAREGVALVVLPELFCFERGRVDDPNAAAVRSETAIARLSAALEGTDTHVATSLVRAGRHVGVLIGAVGVVFEQPQLHASVRHAWSTLPGDRLRTFDVAGARIALVVGDDAIFPETMRLAALLGAEVALVPFSALEAWETQTGLLERSAENRICVVAATRPSKVGTSLITTLWRDFTIMTPWTTRVFDGCITEPIVTRQSPEPGLVVATIHPANAHNKVVSHRTHLLDNRPWALAQALV